MLATGRLRPAGPVCHRPTCFMDTSAIIAANTYIKLAYIGDESATLFLIPVSPHEGLPFMFLNCVYADACKNQRILYCKVSCS